VLSIRAKAAHPQVIGTSRHITQGLIDLLEEKWSAPPPQAGMPRMRATRCGARAISSACGSSHPPAGR